MKKLLILLFLIATCFNGFSQDSAKIANLQLKIDSLVQRLNEKNYTRVPNSQFDKELNTKVRDEVNNWFSGNLLLGGGILAALVTVVLTFGKKYITKELNAQLQGYVNDKTQDFINRFNEHKNAVRDDFKELKQTMYLKIEEAQADMKKYREGSVELFDKYKTDTAESFEAFVDDKLAKTEQKIEGLQNELNETVAPLFNQSVDMILQKANTKSPKNEKDENLVKYLEKLFKKGKLPSEKSASEAIDAIIKYYYYQLNTDKMTQLINEYGETYSLTDTTYANAGLAFLDKYESKNQPEFRDTCLKYCDEAIKKSFDYGIVYTVKLFVYAIDYIRAYADEDKAVALKNIQQLFHTVKFIKSDYIAKEMIDRFEISKNSYLQQAALIIETHFSNELQLLRERANPTKQPELPPQV